MGLLTNITNLRFHIIFYSWQTCFSWTDKSSFFMWELTLPTGFPFLGCKPLGFEGLSSVWETEGVVSSCLTDFMRTFRASWTATPARQHAAGARTSIKRTCMFLFCRSTICERGSPLYFCYVENHWEWSNKSRFRAGRMCKGFMDLWWGILLGFSMNLKICNCSGVMSASPQRLSQAFGSALIKAFLWIQSKEQRYVALLNTSIKLIPITIT